MRIVFLALILIVFGCETKGKKNVVIKTEHQEKIEQSTEIDCQKFFVGDLNNDKINDTAFINLKRNLKSGELEYRAKNYRIDITFSENIPNLTIDHSLGVFIKKTVDLNKDNANEIILFSRTNQGWWNDISVVSYHNGKWLELAKTRGFVSENEDFENRIITENRQFYLIGDDMWNEDKTGNFKKIRVKI